MTTEIVVDAGANAGVEPFLAERLFDAARS
jgi:hypothetical protein